MSTRSKLDPVFENPYYLIYISVRTDVLIARAYDVKFYIIKLIQNCAYE